MKIDNVQNQFLPINQPGDFSKQVKGNPASRDLKLRETAQQMEGIFITQMIKAMEKTIPESSIGGNGQNLAGMMFSSVMGDAIAENGGLGLSDMIYNNLKTNADIEKIESVKNPLLDHTLILEAAKTIGK